jgi:sortase A
VAGFVLVALLLAGIGLGATRPGDDPEPLVLGGGVGAGAALALAPEPPPPAPTATATVSTGLPLPEALPTNPHEATPEVVLGTIELPTLGVSEPLQEGMTLTAINRGPSHWPGTALPGQLGNAVVAGHRTTYTQPFHRLDELDPGDPVVFRMRDGTTHTYAVRAVQVVPEAAIGIAAPHPAHVATLFACHPKGSATHRIVAKLVLLGPDGRPVDAETALPPVDVGLRPGDELLAVRDVAGPAPVTDPFAAG